MIAIAHPERYDNFKYTEGPEGLKSLGRGSPAGERPGEYELVSCHYSWETWNGMDAQCVRALWGHLKPEYRGTDLPASGQEFLSRLEVILDYYIKRLACVLP